MYRLFIVLAIFLMASSANAQQKALTETGREVTLFDNGTWKYSGDSTGAATSDSDSIPVNAGKFVRNPKATFAVKSNTFNVGLYINTANWTFSPHKENEAIPEYFFLSKAGDTYGMMITEKVEIGLDMMKEVALSNAKKASLDAKITNAEYRIVNNQKVLCLELKGTIKTIKFVYLGYYYSNANGTVQMVAYSAQQFYEKNKKSMEDFLNGFTVFEAK